VSFEVAARSYDRFMGRYSIKLAPLRADFATVEPGQRALDVGCGPGALTGRLVRRLGAGSVGESSRGDRPGTAATRILRTPRYRVCQCRLADSTFGSTAPHRHRPLADTTPRTPRSRSSSQNSMTPSPPTDAVSPVLLSMSASTRTRSAMCMGSQLLPAPSGVTSARAGRGSDDVPPCGGESGHLQSTPGLWARAVVAPARLAHLVLVRQGAAQLKAS
jgi:hypothetical protein